MFDLLGLCLIGLQLWVAIPIDLSHLPKKKEKANNFFIKKKTQGKKEREREKKENEEKNTLTL